MKILDMVNAPNEPTTIETLLAVPGTSVGTPSLTRRSPPDKTQILYEREMGWMERTLPLMDGTIGSSGRTLMITGLFTCIGIILQSRKRICAFHSNSYIDATNLRKMIDKVTYDDVLANGFFAFDRSELYCLMIVQGRRTDVAIRQCQAIWNAPIPDDRLVVLFDTSSLGLLSVNSLGEIGI